MKIEITLTPMALMNNSSDINNSINNEPVESEHATIALLIGFLLCILTESAIAILHKTGIGTFIGISVFLFFLMTLVYILTLNMITIKAPTGEHYYHSSTANWKKKALRTIGMATYLIMGWTATETLINLYNAITH